MRLVALALLGGCSSVLGLGDPGPATTATCPIASLDPCATATPTGPIDIEHDAGLNSDRDCNLVLYDPDAGSICVLFGTDITIAGQTVVTGTRPFVLAATGTITVSGTVDASSHAAFGIRGAGADYIMCGLKRVAGTDSNGAGGGAGGSFGGRGGAGGKGFGANGIG